MRNLKKLLAVVVVICILATMAIPAFAAGSFTYETQAKNLYDMKLFQGNSATSYVPALDGSLTREQGITLLVRLFGKEADAKALTGAADILAAYTDAAKVSTWAKNYVAYAVKTGMVKGETATTINPQGKLIGNAFATMILRNLGYADGVYADASATLQTKGGILTADAAKAFGNKELIRDDACGIMYSALLAKDTAGKTAIENLITAGVVTKDQAIAAGLLNALTVTVVDVNKIEVKFSNAVESIPTITLKKGLVPYSTTNTLSEDKKTVTLTSSFNLPEGDYTVSVAGYEDKTVTVAAEKATALTIKSTSFQISATAPVTLALVNQYGKEMTLNRADFTITAFNATKGAAVSVSATKFELDASAAAKDDKVVVSAVYKTGLTATATLPVITAASTASFTFGSVVIPKDQTRVYEANTAVAINYTMKDQYGNDTKLPAGAGASIGGVTFVSTNASVIDPTKLATDADGKLTFTAGTEGTATLTSLVVATGSVSTVTVTVDKKSAVKTFTMSAPAVLIAAGEDVTIPYVAVDQFGAQIAAKDISATDIAKISFASSNSAVIAAANLKFGADNKLTLNAAGAGSAVIYVYFNGTLQNSVSFAVNAKAVATRITGIKDLPAIFEADAAAVADLTFDNLTVVDQYNRAYTLDAETIAVTAKDTDADVITATAATLAKGGKVTFGGTTTVGAEVFTIAINGVAGSSIDYSMSTVATKDITSYALTLDTSKIYKTADADYFATPTLTGKTASGDKVNLVPGKVTNYTSNNPAVAAINAGKVEGVAVGTATIKAWSGTTVLATADVTVVDVAPVATTVAIDNDPAISVAVAATLNMNTLLSVKDQYGVDVTGVAATYATGTWSTSDSSIATIDKATGVITGVKAGDVTIGFVTLNGNSTTVTVTVTAAAQ